MYLRNLSLKPDLFILNSILFRDGERFGSQSFSPRSFFLTKKPTGCANSL